MLLRDAVFVPHERNKNTEKAPSCDEAFLVDVNGLEPLTTRTSSECSTN